MAVAQPSTSVAEYGWVASPVKAGLRPPPSAAEGLDRACHPATVRHQAFDGEARLKSGQMACQFFSLRQIYADPDSHPQLDLNARSTPYKGRSQARRVSTGLGRHCIQVLHDDWSPESKKLIVPFFGSGTFQLNLVAHAVRELKPRLNMPIATSFLDAPKSGRGIRLDRTREDCGASRGGLRQIPLHV